MAIHDTNIKRRTFLKFLASLSTPLTLRPTTLFAENAQQIRRAIPSSKELLPVIGMGSWLTFDVGNDQTALASRSQVLQHFFNHGGSFIDSSPMYGSSEYVIGQCLKKINNDKSLFPATKIWTMGKSAGIEQMKNSQSLWGVNSFKLMQIHNMLDWEDHLETLQEWKSSGRIRYIGITTSHGRRHEALEHVLSSEVI